MKENNIKQYDSNQIDYIFSTMNILIMKLKKGYLNYIEFNKYLNEVIYVLDNPVIE